MFIPYSRQNIQNDDISAVCAALEDDIITCGKRVDEFEHALCEYIGVKFAVVMNSATSALHAGYLALGLSKNDEIITSPITFAATANTAIMCGADVRWAGVDEYSGNIDISSIQSLINPRTKIIVPVDFGGLSVDMDEILSLAKKHNLLVLDDASHALGSTYKGVKVGKKANASVFSFHAIKPITTLEGGALLTDDEQIAKKARLIRSHGISKKELWDSDISVLGYNYRLSDVACALGLSQLKKLDSFIAKREQIALYYDSELCKEPFNDLLDIIKIPNNLKSSRHLYPIKLSPHLSAYKAEIFTKLQKAGIGAQVHYKPSYEFSFYRQKYGTINIPSAKNFYESELSLPCHQLMSQEDANFIISTLKSVLAQFKDKF